MAVIGVDLGGTKISSALLSGADQITCHNKVYLNKAKGEEVGELIKTRIQFLLAEAEKTSETVFRFFHQARHSAGWAVSVFSKCG